MNYKNELIEICKQHRITDESVVILEPYIPFIPENWNGVLVLAESQNLSSSKKYVSRLKSMTSEGRYVRLGQFDEVGVFPWDDGSLKIAVETIDDTIKAECVAVSNAVLWSQVDAKGNNKNPSKELQSLSASMWKQILNVLKPSRVICCGKIAQNVIRATEWEGDKLHLRLPARTAMSRVSGMFNENDLLKRYPEVKRTLDRHPEWLGSNYRLNKIFFACHAVSTVDKI